MLTIRRFYNFKTNIILINGIRIAGFGDEGGIEYDYGDDIHRHVSTADGETVVSRVNDFRLTATITVKETSRGNAILMGLLQQQRLNELSLEPLPFVHLDPILGDLVRSSHAVFLNFPEPSKGRDAGDREFQILLPHAAGDLILGANTIV
jgi:hypothetical protein